jgi:acetoin utilization protein AcuB
MRLKDVMNTDVKAIAATDSAEMAWNRMKLHGIRHLVVTGGKEVVGVLSERDLGGPRGTSVRRGRTAGELMTHSVVTGDPEMTLRRVANLLRGRSIGSLPIVSKGKLVGIVTITDLLEMIGRGAQRPIEQSRKWVMKGRGPRMKPRIRRY